MAALKQRLHRKNGSGSYDVIHLETSADMVLRSDGTTVDAALNDRYAMSVSRTANYVLAAPNGSDGSATFRKLVAADIPSLSASKITSGTLSSSRLPTVPMSKGGTGTSVDIVNAPNNAILRRLKTDEYDQVYYTATKNGALYATSENGSLTFGTLPVAQGGTGATTSTANYVFAAPNGSDGAPTFRKLVAADIPSLAASKITSGTLGVARGGTGRSTLTSGYFLRGNGTNAVTMTAPADVLAAIGAAEAGHTHDVFVKSGSTAAAGLVPAPPTTAGITKYLREDGTWQVPPDTNTTYTHPTSAGNKHIPAGGSSGQILRWSAAGTAVWGADNNTTYSAMTGATSSAAGTSGLVPAPAAGKQASFLRGDGTWVVPTNTTYGVVSTSANGLAPKRDGSTTKFLRADGTWAVPPDTNTDTKVTQAAAITTNGSYPVLLAYSTATTAVTNTVNKSSKLVFNPSTGALTATKVYGAVYNDYAEYRKSDVLEPGRVVCENGDDTLSLSSERLQPGANIISDTFGFAIGETTDCKTPIAVSGRVLVYPYEDRNTYYPGDAVCAAPNGTVSKMNREELINYPERIIGIVSAIPTYDTWGTGKVPVNGRIWVKVR